MFKSHGHTLDDIVIGNMNETDKIRLALSGCDAVFHAAANVNLDIRQIDSTVKSNLEYGVCYRKCHQCRYKKYRLGFQHNGF